MTRSTRDSEARPSADAAASPLDGNSTPEIPTQRRPTKEATPVSKMLELLTVADVLAELKVARSTFYAWKAKGIAPTWRKLPNGELRISREDLLTWYQSLEFAN